MIKVSVLYPKGEDTTFDMDYYLTKHLPMVVGLLGTACKGGHVDAGVSGATPGSDPAFITMSHLLFESIDSFQTSFIPHAEIILGDIPNFTNVQPTIQISDVKM